MKKTITLIALITLLTSCSKYNDQIEIVKTDLSKKNISDTELSEFKFDVIEVLGKDAFNVIDKKFKKNIDDYKELGEYGAALSELKKSDTLLSSYKKIKDKKYYRIHTYRIAGDTVSNSVYFITDKNKIYGIK